MPVFPSSEELAIFVQVVQNPIASFSRNNRAKIITQ